MSQRLLVTGLAGMVTVFALVRPGSGQRVQGAEVRRVVLVSVDGLMPDYYRRHAARPRDPGEPDIRSARPLGRGLAVVRRRGPRPQPRLRGPRAPAHHRFRLLAGERGEMYASFVVRAPGLERKGDLGVVKMTAIAPTLARYLGLTLGPEADTPLPLFAGSAKEDRP